MRVGRARAAALAIGVFVAVALAAPAPALAQVTVGAPPTVTAFFSQGLAGVGSDVALGFTVTNVDVETTLTGVAFDAALPPGLVVSTPNQLLSTCDGSATAPAGGSAIALAGASLAPSASCTVIVDVVAANAGLFSVASGPATSNESGPGSPSNTATLRVLDIVTAASPGITLGAGSLTDTAVVSGPVAPTTGTTVAFALYGPGDTTCQGAPAFISTVLFAPGAGPVTSAPFTPIAAGTYRWRATYTEPDVIPPIVTPCGAAGETVFVGDTPPDFTKLPPAPLQPIAPAPTGPSCAGRPATIVVAAGTAHVSGTPGPDVIVGSARGETIDGAGGDDTICAGDGNDRVRGGAGDDLVLGEAGNDDVRGGTGNDRLAGGDGPDRVDGGSGDDLLDEQNLGGNGHDRLFGGTGRDVIRTAGSTGDKVNCGAGRDRLTMDRFDRQVGCEDRAVLTPPIPLTP
ncbi:MAG TPA: calcium-binding protein [Solirubrobacteraceae bacterium]|nr:calcium-binding protein [Solirubrobacteraceae bacterium]